MEWMNYTPEFECDNYNRDMLKYSPWSGHRLFAYDLIANTRPETVVELGSFYGCSMFTFAQAVKDQHLNTSLNAVDLWEVCDKFTEADYKEDVYSAFRLVKTSCFTEQNLKMFKMTFDQAMLQFDDGSIDILHIDGSHFYEDVKHDYETWKIKVKANGIIMFHDIGDEVINGGIMGSHIFWEELKQQWPWTLQFDFSCGLGLLFLSEQVYKEFSAVVDMEYYQKRSNSFDVALKDDLRKMSFKMTDAEFYISDLKKQLEIKDSHLENYKKNIKQVQEDYECTIKGKDRYISELEKQREDINRIWLEDRKKIQEDYEITIREKDAYIKQLERTIEKMEEGDI